MTIDELLKELAKLIPDKHFTLTVDYSYSNGNNYETQAQLCCSKHGLSIRTTDLDAILQAACNAVENKQHYRECSCCGGTGREVIKGVPALAEDQKQTA